MNTSALVKFLFLAATLSACGKLTQSSYGEGSLGLVKNLEQNNGPEINANLETAEYDDEFDIQDVNVEDAFSVLSSSAANNESTQETSMSTNTSTSSENSIDTSTSSAQSNNGQLSSPSSVSTSSSSSEENLATVNSSSSSVASISVFSAEPGQRWVGYWGSAMNGVGKGNYIAETAPVSNVVFIRDDTPEESLAKLHEARSYGLKAVLMVENVFFPWASSVLYSDYETKFAAYWEVLKDYHDIIAGFYVFDEPFWKNITPGWGTVANATLKSSLKKVIDLIHTKAPGRFTAIAYSTIELDEAKFADLFLPKNLDMWGVNCYLVHGCTDEKLVGYWNKMLQTLLPNQHLLVTLDAYWNSKPSEAVQKQLTSRLRKWKSLIAPDQKRVLGFFPFLYQNHLSEGLYGAQSMSANTKGEYSIYMEGLLGRLYCSTNNLIRIDSQGQVIDRWVNAPMCVPVCESQTNYVRRDLLGNVLDVWWNAPAPYCLK